MNMAFEVTCGRCKKIIKLISDYGGYAIPNQVNLCSECWAIWIEIKTRYNKELKDFWKNVKKS